MTRKVAVTGASGYIGQHLCHSLANRGYDVLAISRSVPGIRHQKITYRQLDMLNQMELTKSLEDVNLIYHLAGTHLAEGDNNIEKGMEINIVGIINLIRAVRKNGMKKLIYTSSAQVYGPGASLPMKESHTPNPLSVYAINKLTAEYYLKLLCMKSNVEYMILRLFNVYSSLFEGIENDNVIKKVKIKLKDNEDVSVSGGESRDFIHISDLITILIKAMESDRNNTLLNVGSGTETYISELVGTMKEKYRSKSMIKLKQNDNPMRMQADIKRLEYTCGALHTRNIMELV